MSNEKKYFEFLDIPDGNGGTDRWHAKDAEAQAAITQIESTIGDINTALDAINGEVI